MPHVWIDTILANAPISRGDVRLGCKKEKEKTIALVTMNSAPSETILNALQAIPNMFAVRLIGFNHA